MDPRRKCKKWYEEKKKDMIEFIRMEDITEELGTKHFTKIYGGVKENYRKSNAVDNNAKRTEITQK